VLEDMAIKHQILFIGDTKQGKGNIILIKEIATA
jgi:hypothetical protein